MACTEGSRQLILCLVRPMKAAFASIILLALLATARSAPVQPRNLIGVWTDPCLDGQGRWEFRRDGKYEFGCGTAIDAGRWSLRHSRLQLVSYDDYLQKTFSRRSLRETIIIEHFTSRFMRVRLPDGRRQTWQRRPNQAMQRTASKPATDVVRVRHPRFGCAASCSRLAVADLVSRWVSCIARLAYSRAP